MPSYVRRILPVCLGTVSLLAAVGSSGLVRAAAPERATRPNVVFVLTDDQRWDQLGSEGHPFLATSNLDRIAAEGVRFANMFVTTSLCSPSRASFLSGLYAHAPARHVWELDRGWKRLQGECGLQDGSSGSVVFVVRGDGKELFRSKVVKDHRARPMNLDVSAVNRLELVAEDAGDGARSDWGVWLAPRLER